MPYRIPLMYRQPGDLGYVAPPPEMAAPPPAAPPPASVQVSAPISAPVQKPVVETTPTTRPAATAHVNRPVASKHIAKTRLNRVKSSPLVAPSTLATPLPLAMPVTTERTEPVTAVASAPPHASPGEVAAPSFTPAPQPASAESAPPTVLPSPPATPVVQPAPEVEPIQEPVVPPPPPPAPSPVAAPTVPPPKAAPPKPAPAAMPAKLAMRQDMDWAQTKATKRFSPHHAAEWLTERTVLMPLSNEQAYKVAELMQPLSLSAGRIHPYPGQPVVASSELLLILRGTITLHLAQDTTDSEPIPLPSLLAGDFWGESAFLDAVDTPRKVIAEVQGDITAACISRDALNTLAQDHPEIAARIMAAVCQSLSQMVRDGHRRVAQASQAMREAQADS